MKYNNDPMNEDQKIESETTVVAPAEEAKPEEAQVGAVKDDEPEAAGRNDNAEPASPEKSDTDAEADEEKTED
jgi:hypothetical protein